jgi:photosystem II stability/assembly factor-like uncharacterized protein
MATYLYLATSIGLLIITHAEGNWEIVKHMLKGQSLTSIVASEHLILAGTPEGIWRSTDNGRTWSKAIGNLSDRHVRWMAASGKKPVIILAGTEPADIFVSVSAGNTWHTDPKIGELRDKYGWFLPYSPNSGCVRGFAIAESGQNPGRVYAAVEVGGVLVSNNSGNTWNLVKGSDGNPDIHRDLGAMVHPDVHSITVHPFSSDIVTASTGGGLYRSTDGGSNWKNLYRCYIRSAWVDPEDFQHIIAGPADGVSRNGRIEESFDGGRTWEPASDGMKTPWPRHMVERFVQTATDLFAILSNGELWIRPLNQAVWQHVLSEIADIRAMAVGDSFKRKVNQ